MISSVLANATINVFGNLDGLRDAMTETRQQLYGMMVFANTMGGKIAQGIISPFVAKRGLHMVHEAMQAGRLDVQQQMAAWQANRPARGAAPALFQAWRTNRPDASAIMAGHVHGVTGQLGRTAMLAGATIMLADSLGKAMHAAGEFNEQLNKTVQTFGNSSRAILEQATKFAGYGVSKSQFISAASNLGIEFMGSGIGEKEAAGMTGDLAGRAADMASLYNIDTADVMHKIASGIAGFGRSLKDLGIIITETRVESKALAMGIWDGKEAITEETKVRARAQIIMDASNRSSGDMDRTWGSLANQEKALVGNAENLMVAVGSLALNSGLAQGAMLLLNRSMEYGTHVATEGGKYWTRFIGGAMGRLFGSGNLATQAEDQARMDADEASSRNAQEQSRIRADEIIGNSRRGGRASFTGLAEHSKNIQQAVFNDTNKKLLDKMTELVGVTKEQKAALLKLGYKNVKSQDDLAFPPM